MEGSTVIRLHPSAAEARRARRQVDDLLREAVEDLRAANEGDLRFVHDVFLAVAQAVRLTMAFGLDVEQQQAAS